MKIISGAFTKLNKFLKANFSMLLLYEIRRKQFIIFCCMYYFSPSVAQNAHYRVIKGNAVNWHSHSLCTIFLFRSRILAISRGNEHIHVMKLFIFKINEITIYVEIMRKLLRLIFKLLPRIWKEKSLYGIFWQTHPHTIIPY